jgi:hypothetical protein
MDISMCNNKEYLKKEECLCFCGTPSQCQSYINFKFICNGQAENHYKWFIQVEKTITVEVDEDDKAEKLDLLDKTGKIKIEVNQN